ncbi:hypothetical protein [Anaerotignum sp.]|uniref:hypothetical protein n=1 Tax=Anaerotignum sp. TaxID=2039241 RepID=UPI0028A582A8|nr:hypothetical protein [Anaerotignum sp.]
MSNKKKRPHGHYCKICGEHKANEKFSGKGHANHICKACANLPATEKAEAQTMNRLLNLPMRRLTDKEKKWLESLVHDSRLEVAELARSVYTIHFPHAERNAMKKQLLINTLTFEIHGEIYDEYADVKIVNRRFVVDRKACTLVCSEFDNNGQEQTVTLKQDKMHKLLKWMVYSLEVFMWQQDYCNSSYLDDLDCLGADDEDNDEAAFDLDCFLNSVSLPIEPVDKMPTWSIHIEYSNHTMQDTACYDGDVFDKVEELYAELTNYFEPNIDDLDKDDW